MSVSFFEVQSFCKHTHVRTHHNTNVHMQQWHYESVSELNDVGGREMRGRSREVGAIREMKREESE